ncbi:MAG: hypothetical protein EBS98_01965 [Chitinophagia bacterium]|nr:hypothetical protein [Chitinophagia bacterium]
MKLDNPITIQPPTLHGFNGLTTGFAAFTLTELDVTFYDSPTQRVVSASIRPMPKSVILWQGDEYDAVGDYTQAQADARLLEKLGPDLKTALENLFFNLIPQ